MVNSLDTIYIYVIHRYTVRVDFTFTEAHIENQVTIHPRAVGATINVNDTLHGLHLSMQI